MQASLETKFRADKLAEVNSSITLRPKLSHLTWPGSQRFQRTSYSSQRRERCVLMKVLLGRRKNIITLAPNMAAVIARTTVSRRTNSTNTTAKGATVQTQRTKLVTSATWLIPMVSIAISRQLHSGSPIITSLTKRCKDESVIQVSALIMAVDVMGAIEITQRHKACTQQATTYLTRLILKTRAKCSRSLSRTPIDVTASNSAPVTLSRRPWARKITMTSTQTDSAALKIIKASHLSMLIANSLCMV